MKLTALTGLDFGTLAWDDYDLIILASGFEKRSTFCLTHVPDSALPRILVLGFPDDLDKLSRNGNDQSYRRRGLTPSIFNETLQYENHLLGRLIETVKYAGKSRPIKILVDYSVMTRSWYGYILTWLKYSDEPGSALVDFIYAHGSYEGEFEPLRINDVLAIPGFEGSNPGSRSTVAAFGLGFDKYAALAVYEQIEPDSLVCYLAQESPHDAKTVRAIKENKEILEISNSDPIKVPLGNLSEIFRILYESFVYLDPDSEIIAVPMGPKPHVLGTLLVAQHIPRVTCLHARGNRKKPVEVVATGTVSAWRLTYE